MTRKLPHKFHFQVNATFLCALKQFVDSKLGSYFFSIQILSFFLWNDTQIRVKRKMRIKNNRTTQCMNHQNKENSIANTIHSSKSVAVTKARPFAAHFYLVDISTSTESIQQISDSVAVSISSWCVLELWLQSAASPSNQPFSMVYWFLYRLICDSIHLAF